MKFKLLLTALLLVIYFCNSKAKVKILNEDSLLLKRVITLEEKNGDTVIIEPIDFSCDSKGKYILILDKTQRKIFVYDSYKGNLVKYLEPSIYFQDSVLFNTDIPKKSSNVEMYFIRDYLSHFNNDSIDYVIKDLQKSSYTRFWSAYFYNDSIISINSQIHIRYIQYINNEIIKVGSSEPFIINYHIQKNTYSFLNFHSFYRNKEYFDNNKKKFVDICISPDLDVSMFDRKKKLFITNCNNHYARDKKDYDSLWSLAYYDANGYFVKEINKLPKEYYDLKLYYNICSPRMLIDNNDDIITAYPILSKIFNVSKNKVFEMTNLTQSNDEYIQNLYENYVTQNKQFDIMRNIPVYINSLYLTSKGNYLIYFFERGFDSTGNKVIYFQHVIQEYNTDGELVNQIHFKLNGENGLLKRIFYSMHDKSLILARVSEDKGWVLEYYHWD